MLGDLATRSFTDSGRETGYRVRGSRGDTALPPSYLPGS